MNNADYRTHIDKLKEISENVNDYLSRELFKERFAEEEDYTVVDILQETYKIVFSELNEYGLYLSTSEEDLLQDLYLCQQILTIRGLVRTHVLRELLKDEEVAFRIDTLTDETESSGQAQSYFTSFMEILLDRYPEHSAVEGCGDMIYEITSSGSFIRHVVSVKEEVRYGELEDTPDLIKRTIDYVAKTRKLRALAKETADEIVSKLFHIQAHLNRTKLTKLINEYDADKLAEIELYSLIDQEEVPEYLQAKQKEAMDIHHRRSPHHLEYWLAPRNADKTISIENLIMLVAHHKEPGVDQEKFLTDVNEMIEKGSSVFTSEQIDFMRQAASVVTKFDI